MWAPKREGSLSQVERPLCRGEGNSRIGVGEGEQEHEGWGAAELGGGDGGGLREAKERAFDLARGGQG